MKQTLATIALSVGSALLALAIAWGGVKAHVSNADIHAPGAAASLARHEHLLEEINKTLSAMASSLGRIEGKLEAQEK